MFYWLYSVLILIGIILGVVLIRLFVEFLVDKIFNFLDFINYRFCVDWDNILSWTLCVGGLIATTCFIHLILITVIEGA